MRFRGAEANCSTTVLLRFVTSTLLSWGAPSAGWISAYRLEWVQQIYRRVVHFSGICFALPRGYSTIRIRGFLVLPSFPRFPLSDSIPDGISSASAGGCWVPTADPWAPAHLLLSVAQMRFRALDGSPCSGPLLSRVREWPTSCAAPYIFIDLSTDPKITFMAVSKWFFISSSFFLCSFSRSR